ncbi:putative neurogenic locus notch-like protein 3 [Apostichopus japonicus]|uniref:Putative neurogenic locus notch-like protein 3 n=1 Tax=Stichopus japonicus TaxID=307972 RepID=A0A2G8KNQ3_STIJA|nr:putative neurogenic locus notch-like protein 3 [Apostichopus japonicus]
MNAYSCVCRAGFTGDRCETDIDECESSDCQNGATCTDGIDDYTCECVTGYEGDFCESEIDECASFPCTNNATCVDTVGSYRCDCPSNFQGTNCADDLDECSSVSGPCNPPGTAECVNTVGGYQCICGQGFEGPHCDVDLDECLSDPCYFGGTCVDGPDSFSCLCPPEFIGTRCEAVVRQCNFNPCSVNSVCVDKPEGGLTCYCFPGYYGDNCETEVNECGSSPCQNGATCLDQQNQFTCECVLGYTGVLCQTDIDECASNPCQNGGVCDESVLNTYGCLCRSGFTGVDCETNVDDCEVNTCKNYQICVDLIDGHRCECPPGLEGSLCQFPEDSCLSDPCQSGGTCLDGDFQYQCQCAEGYEGPDCEIDIDVCEPNPCFHQGECQPYPSRGLQFTCVCTEGFTGLQCEGDIYECISNPCRNGGSCIERTDGIKGFSCDCTDEYAGDFCEIYRFSCYSDPCQNGGICIDTDTGILCSCETGFTGDFCEVDIDECETDPCQHGAACVNQPGSYLCECSPHWSGRHCEDDVPECNAIPPPCQNGGMCLEQAGGAPECLCLPGFEGFFCEEQIDECLSDPCENGASCIDLIAAFACTCLLGYEGVTCSSEIDECLSGPCQNNASCIDELNSYSCLCVPGFEGIDCAVDYNECQSNPCLNSALCLDLVDHFRCDCQPGYVGITCEEDIDECSSSPCENGGVCSDLVDAFVCDCPPGYEGDRCETEIMECASNPCQSGICMEEVNGYRCNCTRGYTGLHCEVDIMECASEPCYFDATCTEPQLDSFHCVCQHGTIGNLCEIVTIASFKGEGAITLPPLDVLAVGAQRRKRRQIDNVRMTFKFATTLPSAVLLYSEGGWGWWNERDGDQNLRGGKRRAIGAPGFISSLGSMVISVNTGSETLESRVSSGLSDGREHGVVLTLEDNDIILVVDDGNCRSAPCQATLLTTRDPGILELNQPLFLGGIGSQLTPYILSTLDVTNNFIGCFQDFYINSELISLTPPTQTPEWGQPRCINAPPCLSNPCLYGATCVDLWTSFQCECLPGFAGDLCEIQTMAHFGVDSFLHFAESESASPVREIYFLFSASSPEPGLLFYMASGFSVGLLNNDSIIVNLLELGGVKNAVIGQNLANGNWISVLINVRMSQVSIEVRDVDTDQVFQDTIVSPPSVTLQRPLLFGKLHPGPTYAPLSTIIGNPNSFSGCIRDLRIDGVLLGLQTHTPTGQRGDPTPAAAGCPREDYCLSTPVLIMVSACRHGEASTVSALWITLDRCVWKDMGGKGRVRDQGIGMREKVDRRASAATFSGDNSYARIVLDSLLFSFGSQFGVEFRTRDEDGIIMLVKLYSISSSQVDFMTLKLEGGTLRFDTSFGGIDELSEVLPVNVTDADWHAVSWERHGSYIAIKADNSIHVVQGNFPLHTTDRNPTAEVYIGGMNSVDGGDDIFLTGCIRNATFNNRAVQYLSMGAQHPGITVSSTNVNEGCTSRDVCRPSPCPTNAFCVDTWNSYSCPCLPGWEGADCTNSIDDCIGHLCENGATCVDAHMNYTCVCPAGLTGRFCDFEIDVCETLPCNEETSLSCAPVFPLDYACTCRPGYEGKSCDVDNRLCTRVPCQNNGTCQQNYENTEYSCACVDFYEGTDCEVYNPCFRHDCLNQGTCVRNDTDYFCECRTGTYGPFCEFD